MRNVYTREKRGAREAARGEREIEGSQIKTIVRETRAREIMSKVFRLHFARTCWDRARRAKASSSPPRNMHVRRECIVRLFVVMLVLVVVVVVVVAADKRAIFLSISIETADSDREPGCIPAMVSSSSSHELTPSIRMTVCVCVYVYRY